MNAITKPHGWETKRAHGELTREPAWRDAVEEFMSAGFQPGEIILHEWFYQQFGICKPEDCSDYKTAIRARLEYVAAIEGLKRELLEEYQVAIKAARGKGYEIVPPEEQTEWAEDNLKQDLRKAVATSRNRLVNIRLDELTDEQRKANLDAQARLSFFRKQARKSIL